ncbi:MAG: MATE family efflux transporter [Bacillota bacterium]|nr:MATE family efflux transporter [Bacillota bacterium]
MPAIGEMVLHMGVWAVDTAMVGRLGAVPLSAAGLGGQLYWTLTFVFALGTGAFALVARHTGAGEPHRAREVTATSIGLAALLGLGLTVTVWTIGPVVFRISGIDPAVTASALVYMRITSLAATMLSIHWIGNSIIRATGNTRVPLLITLLVNGLNLVGDYALIFGRLGCPALGLAGAAWASAAAQAVGGLLTMAFLAWGPTAARLRWREVFRWRGALVRQLARLSAPAGLETLLMDGARALNLFVIGGLGAVAVAGHQVTSVAESLSFMPGYGFATAAGIIVGQQLGAGRPREARDGAGAAWRMGAGFMTLAGVAFLAAPAALVGVFTSDPEVVRAAARLIMIAAVAQPFIGTTEIYTGALRGAGDTRSPLLITAIGAWGVRVPVTVVAIRVLGMPIAAAWWAMVTEWVVRSVLVTMVFRRGRWQQLKL